ncbi:arylphorin subunit alpha [Diachasma alloeum]|uniref:arylphorin subunit alpha n=1 Tax=Diachasma alloeum TaxID=454923 RepID=UPI00073835B5|nr:arylphorin subunit alpha [Diachasma alloeum]
MLRELLVLALTGFCLAQAAGIETHTADMDFLHKQKKIYELFFYIDQPKLIGSEFYEVGRSYDIEQNIDLYKDKMVPREFLYRFKLGMLPRGALFSVYYKEHREELRVLFKLFYYAKDFATFYKTASWARLYMNEGMFIMALTTAVMYRPDCKHIALPPMYEVYPQLFFNNEIIQDAQRIKMTGYKKEMGVGNVETFLINTNYTTSFMKYFADKEYELDYFYDDVGLNNYYYYIRSIFPFWISLKDLEVPKQIRGELYYYVHQQLMARYYLERLSNGFGEIEDFNMYKKFAPGYFSTLVYANGVAQPSRDSYSEVPAYKYKYVKEIKNIEYRILAAIDSGYIIDKEGKQYSLYSHEGLNYLGNLIEGNGDSCNTRFYGSIDVLYRDIFGFNYDCKHKNCVIPSALQLFSTSLRDPAFYRLYKTIIGYFYRYKSNLPAYTKNDLEFSGVFIEDVKLDQLYTFIEEYDYLINNAVTVNNYKDGMNFNVKARKYRLNYKPFTYQIDVKSERTTKGMVRIFMGPSYDDRYFKKQTYFYYNWYNFVEVDKFIVELKTGLNTIERKSTASSLTAKDFPGGDKFYKKLLKAVEGNEPFTYTDKLYGFPDNLYLPRGRVGGYPFKLFVFIYPIDEANLTTFDIPLFGKMLYDGKPFGFPLDRPMYPWYYDLKNMYFKDVYVHYMKENVEGYQYQKELYGSQHFTEKYETYGQQYPKYEKFGKYYGKHDVYPMDIEKTMF